jgi:hypothetical protein
MFHTNEILALLDQQMVELLVLLLLLLLLLFIHRGTTT